MITLSISIPDMLDGYIECALWASVHYSEDDNGKGDVPMDSIAGPSDLTPECRAEMERDCRSFIEECERLEFDPTPHLPDDYIGHNLWLTRNHHGCGFWDRGLGDLGDELTKVAHAMGEASLWCTVDADGSVKVHHE